MRVLCFGTYDKVKHPRMLTLIEGLEAHGDEVLEVNEPLGLSTAERVQALQNAWLVPRLALRVVRRWVTLAIAARRALGAFSPDVVVVGYLGHFDVHLARVLFPRRLLVLDHLVFAADTARDRGTSAWWKLWALDRVDRLALRAADLVLLDTPEHQQLVPRHRRSRCLVVPVGAPSCWFVDSARPGARSGPLRVVFFGLFTPLQGTVTVAQALALLGSDASVEALMIGSGQDLAAARNAAGTDATVEWRPWVEVDELPATLAAADVCLGIFGQTGKAGRVVPNKVYQGAAAGCAVVTSDTPAQRRALGDAGMFVPPGDPAALADALRHLATSPALLHEARTATARVARERFVPAVIVEPLRARLAGLILERRSR